MRLVVDGSVVIPCFNPERFSDVVPFWLEAAELIIAPDFLALELGGELDQPIYDCFYLALAETEGAEIVTADRALWRRMVARRPGLQAHWIADKLPRVH